MRPESLIPEGLMSSGFEFGLYRLFNCGWNKLAYP